jgi:hypothetical protein
LRPDLVTPTTSTPEADHLAFKLEDRSLNAPNDKSIANVAGPAPCLARFLPNSISRSRLSAGSFTLPSASFSAAITAAFDRRGGLSNFVHVFIVQVDQIAKRTDVAYRPWFRRFFASMLRSISSADSSPSLRRRNVSAT